MNEDYKVVSTGDGFRLEGPAMQSVMTSERAIAEEFLRIAVSAEHVGQLRIQAKIRKDLGL